ncbi:MAG: hypothetical protein ABIJ96_08355 [Elusimicrobiota bacterium]
MGDIAALYGVTTRQIRRWRESLGLTDRNVIRNLEPGAASMVRQAEATGKTVEEIARDAIQRRYGGEGGQGTAGPMPMEAHGPLQNEEIKAAMEVFRQRAAEIDSTSDLYVLQRAALKVYALVVALNPKRTWSGDADAMKAVVKTTAWTRKLEAGLPSGPKDEQALRKEAATQLMRELKEALDPADQEVLAVLVKKGADKIMAQHNGSSQHQWPTNTPGTNGRSRNGGNTKVEGCRESPKQDSR